ncbi:transcriptional regulator [Enterococcus faecalis]|uniref:transcriptional regulator n=1 Tax=Enterococcus faecalis TaxID=1351 RepID=UPI001F563CA2|nr:transcriptional regulator [Enterococcus faecalis]
MERIKMVVRKQYDYWGIEITMWNKTNVVAYVDCVDCDCGMLAECIRWKRTEYKCKSCGKQYKLAFGGQYTEVKN